MEYKPNCVKCGDSYASNDPDDYYCDPCLKEKKKLEKEINARIKSKPRKKQMSDLQKFDEIAKQRGSGVHVSIRDMGITL